MKTGNLYVLLTYFHNFLDSFTDCVLNLIPRGREQTDRKDLLRGKGKAGRQDKGEPLPPATVQAR